MYSSTLSLASVIAAAVWLVVKPNPLFLILVPLVAFLTWILLLVISAVVAPGLFPPKLEKFVRDPDRSLSRFARNIRNRRNIVLLKFSRRRLIAHFGLRHRPSADELLINGVTGNLLFRAPWQVLNFD